MKSVTQLRFRYRVVTPAFLGDGDPSCAELRPPSIKAALRFWYRAVDPEFSERDVPRAPVRDSLFFGAMENGAGQSKVLLTVADEQLKYLNSSAIPWGQFVEQDRDRHARKGLWHSRWQVTAETEGSRPARVTREIYNLLPRSNDGSVLEGRRTVMRAWLIRVHHPIRNWEWS